MLPGIREICDLLGVADVQDDDVLVAAEPLFQLTGPDLPFVTQALGLHFLSADPAELLVVDQFRHGGMRAADRAVGVLSEPELPEAHLHGIDNEQPAGKGFAPAQDELHGLGGLDGADDSRAARPGRRLPRSWERGPAGGGSGYTHR